MSSSPTGGVAVADRPTDSVICGQTADRCICGEPLDHEGAHVCECGGSWLGRYPEPTFEIVNLPGPFGGGRMIPRFDLDA